MKIIEAVRARARLADVESPHDIIIETENQMLPVSFAEAAVIFQNLRCLLTENQNSKEVEK